MQKFFKLKPALMGGVFASILGMAAHAETFNIPSGDLATALNAYTAQTGVPLIVAGNAVKGVLTKGAVGSLSADDALVHILKGTGFVMQRRASGTITIIRDYLHADNASLIR